MSEHTNRAPSGRAGDARDPGPQTDPQTVSQTPPDTGQAQDPPRTPGGDISEYLAAREEWDDRFAGQRKTVRVLTGITFAALGLALLGMGYGIYTGARTQYIPHLVMVDELGRAATAPPPERVTDWPEKLIRRELDLFIERLRGVTPDRAVIRDNHSAVDHYLADGSAAATKLRDYFREPENNPITRAETETVAVEVISVNYVTGETWRIEWRETLFDRPSGRERETRRFVATILLTFRTPTTDALLRANPLGLFVTDLDIQEVTR